jgi:hypothetical protein
MKRKRRGLLRFEHMHEPLASLTVVRQRMLASGSVTAVVLAASLALGMAGYHWLVGIPNWVDCLYSASMIMGGMGPVGKDPTDDAGKIFASAYAIYSGVMLLASVGLLLSPLLHRLLHRFHVPTDE